MTIRVGQTTSVQRTFTQSEFNRFAALSGDDNPIHVDPEFAARTRFGQTVAHGMFLYSVVCGVLGTRLPGAGTRQLEQELMFPTATPTGEEVTIRLEVTEIGTTTRVATLDTTVLRAGGDAGLEGRTRVLLPGTRDEPDSWPESPPHPPEGKRAALKGLEIGQWAEIRRAFIEADLEEYACLSGDGNPLFSDAAYARRQGLAGPAIPGSLLGGLFSALLGTELPGQGTNYLKQRLVFPAAACVNEELTACVQIVRIRPEKHLVNLSTTCTNPEGQFVCWGEALVLVRDVEPEG